MKILYEIRVAICSLEAITVALIPFAASYFIDDVHKFATQLAVEDEVMKFIVLLPLALSAWIINELRQLLIEDKEITKVLVAWPDYWRLKATVHVSLFYMVIFSLMSLTPWLIKGGIKSGLGLILFSASLIGQLILSLSVYNARINLREYMSKL